MHRECSNRRKLPRACVQACLNLFSPPSLARLLLSPPCCQQQSRLLLAGRVSRSFSSLFILPSSGSQRRSDQPPNQHIRLPPSRRSSLIHISHFDRKKKTEPQTFQPTSAEKQKTTKPGKIPHTRSNPTMFVQAIFLSLIIPASLAIETVDRSHLFQDRSHVKRQGGYPTADVAGPTPKQAWVDAYQKVKTRWVHDSRSHPIPSLPQIPSRQFGPDGFTLVTMELDRFRYRATRPDGRADRFRLPSRSGF